MITCRTRRPARAEHRFFPGAYSIATRRDHKLSQPGDIPPGVQTRFNFENQNNLVCQKTKEEKVYDNLKKYRTFLTSTIYNVS